MRLSSLLVAGSIVLFFSQPTIAGDLYDAALAGKTDAVAGLLAAGANPNDEGDLGTSLHAAVFQGDLAMITLLLDKGADIENARNSSGWHPLHVAVAYNHPEVVALLLARGAKVDAKEAQGRTSLHKAARDGLLAVAKVLLENGADVRARFGSQGHTALHLACYSNHKEMAALLLAYRADVNASADGDTPLLRAAEFASPEVVELLIAHGADIKVRSKAGSTPLMVAKDNFHGDVAAVLRRHGETE